MGDNLGMSALPAGLPIVGAPADGDQLDGAVAGGFNRAHLYSGMRVVTSSDAYYPASYAGVLSGESKELHVYVKSDVNWISGYTADHGEDSWDGLTPTTPKRTIAGIRRAFERHTDGYRIIVHMMANGADPDVVTNDLSVTGPRLYLARQLPIGVSDAWQGNWSWRAPHGMIKTGPVATNLVSYRDLTSGPLKGLTEMVFGGTVPAVGPTGVLFWTRDSGAEVVFPFPAINGTGADANKLYTGAINAAVLLNGISQAGGRGNNWQGAFSAVYVDGDGGDHAMRSVHLVGQGPMLIGDRHGDVGDHDMPCPTVERAALCRPVIEILGSSHFECCPFADHLNVRYGEPRMGNCTVEGNVYWDGMGRGVAIGESQSNVTLESIGRITKNLAPSGQWWTRRYTTDIEPEDPIPGIDLALNYRGSLIVGTRLGGSGGSLRIIKGLWIGDARTDCVAVVGKNSSLYLSKYARVVLNTVTATDHGIWCRAGAEARVNDSTSAPGYGLYINGTANHVRVGKGAAIAQGTGAGALCDPATWNGNFDRRLENVGGYPIDDGSRIWDVGWEPANYRMDNGVNYAP